MEGCLGDDVLAALAEGVLTEDERTRALEHVAGCSTCADFVTHAVRVTRPPLGRYTVLGELGSGGMGQVYRAYDPKLEREVAVKVVRSDRVDAGAGARRLLREARALAQLNHRNVAAVFDVEDGGDEVFIAMELVSGRSLREWLTEPRRTTEILSVFLDAGRGLGAAHAAGLVHRDFKPSNVMVAHDGRVVVLDFGLARRESSAAAWNESVRTAPMAATTDGVGEVTATGAVAGTPIYMAPEQYDGAADARSDQYAFCLSLVEALCGAWPFSAKNFETLQRDKSDGAFDAEAFRNVPQRLRRALRRGLSASPDARWPDMPALVRALTPKRRATTALALAGGGLAVAVLVVVSSRVPECDDGADRIEAVWNEERQPSNAVAVARIDGYARKWVDAFGRACDVEAVGTTVACLSSQLRKLDHLLAALADADPDVARSSLETVQELDAPDACFDPIYAAGVATLPDDPAQAAIVLELEGTLARARALTQAGRYAPALRLLDGVLTRAENARAEPLVVQAMVERGGVLRRTGSEDAQPLLEAAYERARLAGTDVSAGWAALDLLHLAKRAGDVERFENWRDRAKIDVARARMPLLSAALYRSLGAHHQLYGEVDEAFELYRQALEALRSVDATGSQYGMTLMTMGGVLLDMGREDDARERYAEAESVLTGALGPEHPRLGILYYHLGGLAVRTGDPDGAVEHFEHSLRIEEAKAEGSRNLFAARSTLGYGYYEADRLADARAQFELTLGLAGGVSAHGVAEVLVVYGHTLAELGESVAALDAHLRGIELLDAAPPSARRDQSVQQHRDAAIALYEALGRNDEAAALRSR